jgi:alkyl sulfatase BDS1-like metallo-beta-lactamase superfamily hydrolase
LIYAEALKYSDAKGKPPYKFTTELQNGVGASLLFEDRRDFEEAKKGLIGAPPYNKSW